MKPLKQRVFKNNNVRYMRCISSDKDYVDIPIPGGTDGKLRECLLKHANQYHHGFFDNVEDKTFDYYFVFSVVGEEFDIESKDNKAMGMNKKGDLIRVDVDTLDVVEIVMTHEEIVVHKLGYYERT